jgi:glycosyltransferase involved in cell wall biosynthesis
MGKAAVANDQPEQIVVLKESKAGICVPYNEKAFCDAIVFLLKNQDLAHKMGVRGRNYIEAKRNYKQTADIVDRKMVQIASAGQSSF